MNRSYFSFVLYGMLLLLTDAAVGSPDPVKADLPASPALQYRFTHFSLAPEPSSAQPNVSLSAAQTRLRVKLLTWGTVGVYAAYGFSTWWQDAKSHFSTREEEWFGVDSYAGGADKLGHLYSTYISTRLLARAYRWAGMPRQQALRRAGNLAALTLTGVEIMDGFTQEYGFSWEDFIMNSLGIVIAHGLETHPAWDASMDLRVLYRRSDDAREKHFNDPIGDYSGQIYLLVLKPAQWAQKPPLSKWHLLEIAAGYGTQGYRPLTRLNTPKQRNLYLGLSLNLSKLMQRYWYKKPTQNALTTAFEYIQVPGTVALLRHDLN